MTLGRGPTIAISPLRTLISWKNSSIFNLLTRWPILVILGSFSLVEFILGLDKSRSLIGVYTF